MRRRCGVAMVAILFISGTTGCSGGAEHADPVERGQYLATVGGCHDCHTPKVFSETGPELDPSRLLAGHPAGDVLPDVPGRSAGPNQWGAITNTHLTAWAGPWGVSYAPNLTTDATGIGDWTVERFIEAMRAGPHAGDGRPALPPLPRFAYAKMSDRDLRAIFAYLRSLPPVANAVPPSVPPPDPPAMATAGPAGG